VNWQQFIKDLQQTTITIEMDVVSSELWKWYGQPCPSTSEPTGPIVEGSITPVIDDPTRLLPAKECES